MHDSLDHPCFQSALRLLIAGFPGRQIIQHHRPRRATGTPAACGMPRSSRSVGRLLHDLHDDAAYVVGTPIGNAAASRDFQMY
jgi:hypothetical protein